MTQDVPPAGPWVFSVGDWKLHLTFHRNPSGGGGIEICTVPPVYAVDLEAANRVMGELRRVLRVLVARAGCEFSATELGLMLLVPHIRTWVEDVVRRGLISWEPGRVQLFICRCAEAGRAVGPAAP